MSLPFVLLLTLSASVLSEFNFFFLVHIDLHLEAFPKSMVILDSKIIIKTEMINMYRFLFSGNKHVLNIYI